jgi:cell division protein FtsZ
LNLFVSICEDKSRKYLRKTSESPDFSLPSLSLLSYYFRTYREVVLTFVTSFKKIPHQGAAQMINIKMQTKQPQKLAPKIAVVGVGGAGGNAVNNMIASSLEGCEFIVCNTDAQALENSVCMNKVQLGIHVTGGLGAGSKPEIGRAAAEESLEDVMKYLEGAHMCFVTAGMGGGSGTGAAPVLAKACRERGILTVGVVTKPFHFEGTHRMRVAETGIREMQDVVDTLIVIPNQNLFRIANEKTTFAEAFRMADGVLQSGVRGVTDLMVRPGLVNLDFADIRTAMMEMGKAMMGTGEGRGDKRAIEAAEAAINNPLLDDISMKGARGVIINVTGGYDMTLFEADEACNRIRDEVDPEANIIFGATFDETLEGVMRVSIVATGIEKEAMASRRSTTGGAKIDARGKPALERAQPKTETAPVASAPVAPQQAAPLFIPAHHTSRPFSAPPALTAQQTMRTTPAPQARLPEPDVEMFEQREFVATENPQQADVPQNTAMRGARYKDSFIPPRPMDPSAEDAAYDMSRPAGFGMNAPGIATHTASSLQLNPPKLPYAQKKQRPPSLFERITGTVQQHLDGFRGEAEETGGETQQGGGMAPSYRSGPPLSAPPRPAQGTLNIDAPAGRPRSSEEELDIPAFLRRQAN